MLLRSYFRSGWAFFIPYLAAYLLYAWLKWPVNPTQAGARGMEQGARGWVPCLLHVYWAIHAIHLLLGATALGTWLKGLALKLQLPISTGAVSTPSPLTGLRIADTAYSLLPWILLGLIFLLPGIYWEFPGDVWEHYVRINDWSFCTDVSSYTGWTKSAYFTAFSLVGKLSAESQQFWLEFYYTGMCLLVCWQFYLLLLEARLSRSLAFVVVLLQAILLGNSLFSFYRYYGLASTAPAQLGAIALIRICLSKLTAMRTGLLRDYFLSSILQTLACLALLIVLISFNHPQALGIAFLGLVAVVIWQVGEWKRVALLWLGAGGILSSLAILCFWPISPALSDVFRANGWMTRWYSFNLFSFQSPASERSMQILGSIGLMNLFAGIWLLRRNHIAGWLTLTPMFALLCPLFSIPYATLLSRTSVEYIIVAPRMLLGIPVGMALVVVCQGALSHFESLQMEDTGKRTLKYHAVIICSLVVMLVIPANAPFYNRIWQAIARTPSDLALQQAITDFSVPALAKFRQPDAPHFLTTNSLGFAARAAGFMTVTFSDRVISYPYVQPTSAEAEKRFRFLSNPRTRDTVIYIPSVLALHTTYSMAGILSGHWLAQEVALGHATGPETRVFTRQQGADQSTSIDGGTLLLITR